MVEQLTLLVVAIAGLPVSGKVIVVAGVVLALVVVIIGFLVYRSGGNKTNTKAATGTGNNEWQRQPQQAGNAVGNANGWNSQGQGNDMQQQWAPQQGQGQQAGWNTPVNSPQQGWGAPQQNAQGQPGMPAWANSNQNPNSQGANSPWGDQGNATVPAPWGNNVSNGQQAANPWAASNQTVQPVPTNQWDQQRNLQDDRSAWDPQQAAPVARDPWNQQPQQWGGQSNGSNSTPYSPQGAQGGFAGTGGVGGSAPSWNPQGFNQNGNSDGWNSPQQQQQPSFQSMNNANGFSNASNAPQAPSWQQQNGFNQGNPNVQQNINHGTALNGANNGFNANDNDRTIMRPANAIGLVRVEEGKEPGREYKIVKDALSIGRSRESDIFLEDLAVSRLHASVVNQGNGQYALRDEGSANGTMVNGQLVGKLQVYPLQEGDRIKLGQTVLVFSQG
jgi:hypothetical protein